MGLVVNGGIDTETVLKTVEEYKVPPPSKQQCLNHYATYTERHSNIAILNRWLIIDRDRQSWG
ncbi:unnamed protein product, partial [Rotaria socialis]